MKKKLLLILFVLALVAISLFLGRFPRQEKTPGPAESAAPAPVQGESTSPSLPQPLAESYGGLRISELMIKNKASVLSPSGQFCDWAELENLSGSALSLEGWALSDRQGQARWRFPAGELEADGRLLVYFDGIEGPDFSLSPEESLYLLSPDGAVQDMVLCASDTADCSLCRQPDGSFVETPWISPGFENGPAGYEAWSESRIAGTLAIYEAVVSNQRYVPTGMREPCDWVELRNLSDETLNLAGISLSDDGEEPGFVLPELTLAPGESLLLCCHNDEKDGSIGNALNTGFSLDATRERLYLRDGDGALLDWVSLHDIPVGGSMGRMEGRGGFFYFSQPSPRADNAGGARRVAAMPAALSPDGVFDDVEQVTVELSGAGEIRYTLDGTVPTEASPVYEGPITVDKTTLLRAVCLEEDALPSRPLTLSYIVNEHHTLPVLSVAVDDANRFYTMYTNGYRVWTVSGNLALYDGEHSFNRACDVRLRGWTSLNRPKKSLGVSFKGCYGGHLDVDVFGNGITEYSTLAIRGGQDYIFSIFRNELLQDLCREASDAVLTQDSKYCILYVDGKYYGIYALKEDFSRQYYASHAGVSVDSVEALKFPVAEDSAFYRQLVDPSWREDFSRDEVYLPVAEQLDLDSLIDWFLLESWCANTDIQGNLRAYRSPESGSKWSFCFYDLDWAFYYPECCFGAIIADYGNAGHQIPPLIRALLQNPDFRDRTLRRFAELLDGPLSNEHVLAKIDAYQALLEPEAPRDRERWGMSMDQWHSRVDELRSFITDQNWELFCIDQICMHLDVSPAERAEIFGR
jgi:hypothetical protein